MNPLPLSCPHVLWMCTMCIRRGSKIAKPVSVVCLLYGPNLLGNRIVYHLWINTPYDLKSTFYKSYMRWSEFIYRKAKSFTIINWDDFLPLKYVFLSLDIENKCNTSISIFSIGLPISPITFMIFRLYDYMNGCCM